LHGAKVEINEFEKLKMWQFENGARPVFSNFKIKQQLEYKEILYYCFAK